MKELIDKWYIVEPIKLIKNWFYTNAPVYELKWADRILEDNKYIVCGSHDYYESIDPVIVNKEYIKSNPEVIIEIIYLAITNNVKIDTETMDAIMNNALSLKRINVLFLKMFAALWWDAFSNFLRFSNSIWILELIIPSISRMKYFNHNFSSHPEWNVFEHTLACLSAYKWNDYNTILAILFHDIGKILTYWLSVKDIQEIEPMEHFIDMKYRHRYISHDIVWANYIKLFKEIELSDLQKDIISFCCENHMKIWNYESMSQKKCLDIRKHKYYNYLKDVYTCDELSRHCEWNIEIYMERMGRWLEQPNKDKLYNMITFFEWLEESVNKNKKKLKTENEKEISS